MVITVTRENFEEKIVKSDKPVLIDFWASWCGPCRMMVPVVEEIAAENPGITVAKVNVDEERDIAGEFGIMIIPTFVVLKDGKVTARVSGVKPKEELLELVMGKGNVSQT
ncbi:MAG: thioredoxin [Firmicutes bacterium]|nr:thioredoxin [Bacillota bacterium]